MRIYHLLLTYLVAAIVVGCGRSPEVASVDVSSADVQASPPKIAHATSTSGIYTVDDYHPERDADADLLMTIDQAKASNKRIILEIGGQW